MKNKIKIETLLTGIAAFLLLAFLVLIPIDTVDFFNDNETYARVYHLNTNEENWEWGYLSRGIYTAAITFIGLTIISLRLIKKDNEIIKQINWTFLFLFFGSMIIGFYNWMKTGFDH